MHCIPIGALQRERELMERVDTVQYNFSSFYRPLVVVTVVVVDVTVVVDDSVDVLVVVIV